MSRIVTLIALALAAAAVAASIADGRHRYAGRDDRRPARSQHAPREGLHPAASRGLDDRRLLARAEAGGSASGRRGALNLAAATAHGRSARSQLPDRAGPHPERGHVLDGWRLLARGQGRVVLRDVRADAHTSAPARSASAGATPASAPPPPSASSSSSAASAQHSSPAADGPITPPTRTRVIKVRVELPSYSTKRAGLRARPSTFPASRRREFPADPVGHLAVAAACGKRLNPRPSRPLRTATSPPLAQVGLTWSRLRRLGQRPPMREGAVSNSAAATPDASSLRGLGHTPRVTFPNTGAGGRRRGPASRAGNALGRSRLLGAGMGGGCGSSISPLG